MAKQAKIEVLLARIDERLKSLTESIDRAFRHLERHSRTLYGNNGQSAGLVDEVRALKAQEERRRWHFRVIWTAIVGSIGSLVAWLWSRLPIH